MLQRISKRPSASTSDRHSRCLSYVYILTSNLISVKSFHFIILKILSSYFPPIYKNKVRKLTLFYCFSLLGGEHPNFTGSHLLAGKRLILIVQTLIYIITIYRLSITCYILAYMCHFIPLFSWYCYFSFLCMFVKKFLPIVNLNFSKTLIFNYLF